MRIFAAVLLFFFSTFSHAFSCVSPANVGQALRVSQVNVSSCGTDWTIFTPSDVTAYNAWIAETQAVSAVVVSSDALQPFDATTAASFWSFSLLFSLGLWLVAKNVGTLLSMFRPRSK